MAVDADDSDDDDDDDEDGDDEMDMLIEYGNNKEIRHIENNMILIFWKRKNYKLHANFSLFTTI